MKTDRLLFVLTVVVLAAAAAVFVAKRAPAPDEPADVTGVPGSLSLLVVGVESLDLSIVERLSAEGRLPNITSLMERGAFVDFDTFGREVDRRISWTSLVTGVTPERQGIGGMKVGIRGDIVPAPLVPKSRTVGTLWTALSDSGVSVGLIGWFGSWPVEQLNGVVVAPYMTYFLERRHNGPPERQLYPLALSGVVDPLIVTPEVYSRRDLARFVDEDCWLGLEALIGKAYLDLATAYAGDTSTRDLALAFTSDPGVEAEFVLLPGVELVSQRFWHMAHPEQMDTARLTESVLEQVNAQVEALGGVIDLYYETVDEILGELLDLAAEDATVALVSDHGYVGLRYGANGQPLLGANMHNETGFWVLRGPTVKEGVRVSGLELLDFAPTVAAAAGITLEGEIDGATCREILLQ